MCVCVCVCVVRHGHAYGTCARSHLWGHERTTAPLHTCSFAMHAACARVSRCTCSYATVRAGRRVFVRTRHLPLVCMHCAHAGQPAAAPQRMQAGLCGSLRARARGGAAAAGAAGVAGGHTAGAGRCMLANGCRWQGRVFECVFACPCVHACTFKIVSSCLCMCVCV